MWRANFRKNIRIQKLQNKHHMVGQSFNVLATDERRKRPWLGGWQFEPGREEEVREYIRKWEEETERLLKINPNLKLVD